MSIITKKINEKINTLKSEFEANRHIVHNGIKGSLNEIELSSLIKDVIPQRYEITKGIIENSKGEQSNETDVFIYDDEILPSYMKHDLSFVPVEAVKYNFEVKSTLDSNELKTTVDKFIKFKSIGGSSPTVLFAFSSDIKGSELLRYYKNEDENFFINPSISVINVSGKCYYFKSVKEFYLKDHFSNKEWLKIVGKSMGLDVEESVKSFQEMMSNEGILSQMDRATFARSIQGLIHMDNSMNNLDNNEITLNDVNFSEIKYKIHKWVGIEQETMWSNNDTELSLLSGISNTLSKGNFGNYLLNNKNIKLKTFALCFEDMWGNLTCKDFDKNGLSYNENKFNFTYKSTDKSHKLTFKIE